LSIAGVTEGNWIEWHPAIGWPYFEGLRDTIEDCPIGIGPPQPPLRHLRGRYIVLGSNFWRNLRPSVPLGQKHKNGVANVCLNAGRRAHSRSTF